VIVSKFESTCWQFDSLHDQLLSFVTRTYVFNVYCIGIL